MTSQEQIRDAHERADSYSDAFYELGKLMDIPSQSKSPREVWVTQMLPRLRALLSQPPSLDMASVPDAVEAADYLIDAYKRLWRGDVCRDLAEAEGWWSLHRDRLLAAAPKNTTDEQG